MRESSILYQFLKQDETFCLYAPLLHYQGRILVINEEYPYEYILIHTITETLHFEPVYLLSDSNVSQV